ncbi:MAG: nucleotidyltransferase family protein [Epsilonproteobacteria bacterium]|nr:nucleotidyltransferase family protein [Campylobacterota bacterium]
MKAMILSAGLGTRMRPLTNHTPKPLLEVGGKPLIVWHIERLREAGFRDIVINVAYLGYKIMDYLKDGVAYGVNIEYSDEQDEGALETAGGIIKALPLLSDTFLVLNGDIWTDYLYDNSFKFSKDILAHLVLIDNPEHNPTGDFILDGSDKKYTFSGIGYYSKELFRDLDYGKRALAPLLFQAQKDNRLTTEYFNGEWYDIGTPERLKILDKKLLDR